MGRRKIYLDNAATTPTDRDVFEAMRPYFCDKFGNASSAHQFGKEAREAVEKTRVQVADFLGCTPGEIIFTSCATESNNLAIKGTVTARNRKLKEKKKWHIITTNFEHHCVLNTCRALEQDGLAEVTYLPINKEGLIKPKQVEEVIKDNTILVSIIYANNEIGTIQPIKEIGELVKNINKSRNPATQKPSNPETQQSRILFHTDAVQAVNYLDCNVDNLGVDLLSISAHKFYGPKGVGVLYIRKGTPIARIQDGGEHEFKLRSGTLNVPGIVGMGEAISNIKYEQVPRDREQKGTSSSQVRAKIKIIEELRDKLIDGVLEKIPNSKLNGSREKRLPNNANFSFPGAEGEAILLALDLEGVAVSTGSACASESLKPSHVLVALGLGPEDTHSSIRMSLGKHTTKEDIDYVLQILPGIVERLRKISGAGQEQKKAKLPDDFGC